MYKNNIMPDTPITERQKYVLALIIQLYARTTNPVGSNSLLEEFDLQISSATIRNEMAALDNLGFLRKEYQSAGRVPTEEGYRYFVKQLMGQSELPAPAKRTIAHQFHQARHGVGQQMRLAASVLANQSQAASLVTAPHSPQARFQHLELINVRGRQVLMVLVLTGGEVRQQILSLNEPITQERLSVAAEQITGLCSGLDSRSVAALAPKLDALENDILKLVLETLTRSDSALAGDIYRDGLIHMLSEPEFASPQTARKALRVLEERTLLEDLIQQTVLNADIGVVQVLIGGEGQWEELRECSVVLARYGAPDLATGTVGVLGPMRMRYNQSISAVRYVAGLLSDMVIDTHEELSPVINAETE